jgi:hypothetical protein
VRRAHGEQVRVARNAHEKTKGGCVESGLVDASIDFFCCSGNVGGFPASLFVRKIQGGVALIVQNVKKRGSAAVIGSPGCSFFAHEKNAKKTKS